MDFLQGIFIGALSSILAAIVIAFSLRGKNLFFLISSSRRLAMRLREGGITKFHLSRDQYGRTLRTYLSQAVHSIVIVSVSLKVTHDEGDIAGLFQERISENPDFRATVSLLNPRSPAVAIAAASLNITPEQMSTEIQAMLTHLVKIRQQLPALDRVRLVILIHDCLPMGSAILLDAAPFKGTIQVETKLFRAPRAESFSYEVKGPSPFYTRNYRAWMKVLDESKAFRQEDVQPMQRASEPDVRSLPAQRQQTNTGTGQAGQKPPNKKK